MRPMARCRTRSCEAHHPRIVTRIMAGTCWLEQFCKERRREEFRRRNLPLTDQLQLVTLRR